MIISLTASAQQGITVKGTVVDDNGETIIGASVVVKGNNSIGTISDIDGNFVLTVPNEKSVLVVSFVGMEPQEVKASSKGTIKVELEVMTPGRLPVKAAPKLLTPDRSSVFPEVCVMAPTTDAFFCCP